METIEIISVIYNLYDGDGVKSAMFLASKFTLITEESIGAAPPGNNIAQWSTFSARDVTID